MKSEFTGQTRIYRREYSDRVFYNAAIAKKNADGEWENTSIGIQFPRGVDLPDKTKIHIRKAWLSFYISKDKKPVFYIICTEFDVIDAPEAPGIPEGFTALDDDEPF